MLALGISWGNVLEFCMMLNERHGDRRSQALHVVQGRCEVHVPYETYVSLQDVRRDVRRAQSEQAVNPCETLNFRSLSSSALVCTFSQSLKSFMFCGAQSGTCSCYTLCTWCLVPTGTHFSALSTSLCKSSPPSVEATAPPHLVSSANLLRTSSSPACKSSA